MTRTSAKALLLALLWTAAVGVRAQETDLDALLSLGELHQRAGDAPRALDVYRQALELARQLGRRKAQARILDSTGVLHKEARRFDAALADLEASLDLKRELGLTREFAPTLNHLGDIHRQRGDYERALEYFNEALATDELLDDPRAEAMCLQVVGECYLGLRDFTSAREVLERSLDITRDLGAKRLESKSLSLLARTHEARGDLVKALETTRRFKEVSDQILALEREQLMAEMGARAADARREAEIERLRLATGVATAGLVTVLLLAGGLSRAYLLNRRANHRLAEKNREIEHQKDELRAAKHAAEAASRAKSSFLANMSHELRTPLNAVLGHAQILRRDATLDTEQRENAEIIRASGEHLLALIDDVLDMAKIEAGKIDLEPRAFPLCDTLDDVVDMVRLRAAEKELEFRYLCSPRLPTSVHGDAKRLQQVLLNLLGNAVKFTDAGCVTFEVELVEAARVCFTVRDTGLGIPDEQLGYLFRPFERVGDPRRDPEGAGLGLAISQRIVGLMGGEIEVASTPGQGSTFRFEIELPAASATEATPAPTAAEATPAPAAQPRLAPPPEELERLDELARIGDLQGILTALDGLERSHGELGTFVDELRRLAAGFDMRRVRRFLADVRNPLP